MDISALSTEAATMAQSKPDVLVALGSEPLLEAFAHASKTIPIVFVANNYDPLDGGYVQSLAKPGGNITGVFLRQTELAEKQVALLIEAFPDRRRLAVLWDRISADQFEAAQRRAGLQGLEVISRKMENPPYDIRAALAEADRVFAIALRRNVRPCSLLARKLPDPVRVVSAIREQHRLREQGAEESRAQPIVMRFTGREGEMDRRAIGVHHRVYLARQATSRATHILLIVVRDTGSVLVHAHDRRVDHLHSGVMTGCQRIHNLIPDASPPPANEAIVTSGAVTVVLRQVAPWRT
jgi:hypothetical protein